MTNTLPAGTHPLPYVAVGMRVRFRSPLAGEPMLHTWTVSEVSPFLTLRDGEHVTYQNAANVRRSCELAEPFVEAETSPQRVMERFADIMIWHDVVGRRTDANGGEVITLRNVVTGSVSSVTARDFAKRFELVEAGP